jgi:tellurite resistance protein
MGVFDKIFKVNASRLQAIRLSSDEAFLAIVFSAIMADNEINRDEMNHLMLMLSKFKGLGRLNPAAFQNLMNRFQKIIRQEGVGTLINAAKDTLDKGLRETAFANAVELVLTDGVFDPKEKEFLEKLKEAVHISDELAEKIIDVVIIKNRGSTSDIFSSSNPDKMFYS